MLPLAVILSCFVFVGKLFFFSYTNAFDLTRPHTALLGEFGNSAVVLKFENIKHYVIKIQ